MIQCRTSRGEASIGNLFRDLADETRTLLRQEVDLAKAEMGEKVSTFSRNAIYIVIGGVVALLGAFALVGAACVGLAVLLSKVMDGEVAAWLGPLIVGLVIGLIGYGLIQKALSTLKRESLVPRKTIDSLRENTAWFKDQMTNSDNRMSAINARTRSRRDTASAGMIAD